MLWAAGRSRGGGPLPVLHSEVKRVPGPRAPWVAGGEAAPLQVCSAPSASSVLSFRVWMGGFHSVSR